jgi:hypothetical protein
MFTSFVLRLERSISLKAALIALVVLCPIIFVMGTLPQKVRGNSEYEIPESFMFKQEHTADNIRNALDSFGEKGRRLYMIFSFVDDGFAVVRPVTIIMANILLSKKYLPNSLKFVVCILGPLLGGLVDLTENQMMKYILFTYPTTHVVLEQIFAFIEVYKFKVFAAYEVGSLIFCVLVRIFSDFATRFSSKKVQ